MLKNIETKFQNKVLATIEGDIENKIIIKLYEKESTEQIIFYLFYVHQTNYAYYIVADKGDFSFSKERSQWVSSKDGYEVEEYYEDGKGMIYEHATEFEMAAINEIQNIIENWNNI